MKTVNVHEAKTNLSKLLARVERGEEIVISRGDRPVARLLPYATRKGRRVLGADHDAVRIAEDFDAPLPPDVLADFEA